MGQLTKCEEKEKHAKAFGKYKVFVSGVERLGCVRRDVTAEEEKSRGVGRHTCARGEYLWKNVLHQAQEASAMMYDK